MWVPRPIRHAGRWLSNWRNGATVLASVVIALVAFVVIDASQARQEALDARNRTATAATRRIDKLNDKIGETDSRQIGETNAKLAALEEQIRQLGGKPVVVSIGSTQAGSTPPPSTTSTTSPRPTTTTTTTPPQPRCVLVICV
jgi:hypothetical protein